MNPLQNILVAIDFKATEQAEIDHAISLAKTHNAKLTFISVIPPLPRDAHLEISAMTPEQRLERQLAQRLELLETISQCAIENTGIETECVVTSGVACIEIIKHILRNDYDLLMLAERENNSLIKNKLIGSTARELLRKAPCPVLAVHPKHSSDYKRIMVTINVNKQKGVDDVSLNNAIIAEADSIAQAEHSSLSMVSIMPNDGNRETHLNSIKTRLADNDVTIDDDEIYIHTGEPAQVIVDATIKHNTDLLVMGMLSRTGIQGFFIGNTVEKVMDDVECSILTVKPKEFVCPIKL